MVGYIEAGDQTRQKDDVLLFDLPMIESFEPIEECDP